MSSQCVPSFLIGRQRVAWLALVGVLLPGCAYVDTTVKQAGYAAQQVGAPQKRIIKHMLSRETFFVVGQIEHAPAGLGDSLAVLAISDEPRPGEVVDVNYLGRAGTYYGLNLPEGDYRLVVAADRNRDGFYDPEDIVGGTRVSLNVASMPDKVVEDVILDLREPPPVGQDHFHLGVPKSAPREESLFFPKGALRTLDDPIFDRSMATMGMFEPAAFIEAAPTMFYAFEETAAHKIPVVFVHGIGGSPRDFAPMIEQLDRTRFQPWFFYYPSGSDLRQTASLFYKVFLAGRTIPLKDFPIAIVSHSMGGLVVREAFNHCTGSERETPVQVWITLASPIGGHPAARMASKAPVVVPSWRNLDPQSPFIAELRRKPLPPNLEYHLMFAYGDDRRIKMGENSDSVVPLSSQLTSEAQKEATAQYGFDDTHVGILSDPEAIRQTLTLLSHVKPVYPEDHRAILLKGGYALQYGPRYSPVEAFLMYRYGCYLDALVDGVIKPVADYQEHFLAVVRGEASPNNPAEKAWLKMNRDFPDRRTTAETVPPP